MNRLWFCATAAALAAALPGPARAAVRLHGLFTDGAVLQRDARLPIWGTASNGERVTVTLGEQKASTVAENGKWRVWLKPMKAGGPFTLTVEGETRVVVNNVMVGEVWICSGQSNMEWPLLRTENAESAIAASADSQLRLAVVAHNTSETPLEDVSVQWKECGPGAVDNFSAVAYYFGRDLRRALHVPVGLIQTAWGGTVCEAWTSRSTLEADPELRVLVDQYAAAKRTYPARLAAYQIALSRYREEAEAARQAGRQPPRQPAPPPDPNNPGNPNRPAVLYNAMIAPLIPYAIRGAIWYQGESNANRAHQYRTLFPAMIRNWREAWGEGDFPFLFVQLAPFMAIRSEPQESAWAELREAQRLTILRVPKTAMAVITDCGDERDIHPRRKEPVGSRLALAARALAYGERIVYSGPMYDSMKVEGNRVVLRFRHVGGGLVCRGERLTGFTVAGDDRKWYPAEASIEGDRVVVSCPQVTQPAAVRFGWADYPVVNLYNREGLPASPFRTDDWPLTTQPK